MMPYKLKGTINQIWHNQGNGRPESWAVSVGEERVRVSGFGKPKQEWKIDGTFEEDVCENNRGFLNLVPKKIKQEAKQETVYNYDFSLIAELKEISEKLKRVLDRLSD